MPNEEALYVTKQLESCSEKLMWLGVLRSAAYDRELTSKGWEIWFPQKMFHYTPRNGRQIGKNRKRMVQSVSNPGLDPSDRKLPKVERRRRSKWNKNWVWQHGALSWKFCLPLHVVQQFLFRNLIFAHKTLQAGQISNKLSFVNDFMWT
jgi:hypothetical protein